MSSVDIAIIISAIFLAGVVVEHIRHRQKQRKFDKAIADWKRSQSEMNDAILRDDYVAAKIAEAKCHVARDEAKRWLRAIDEGVIKI